MNGHLEKNGQHGSSPELSSKENKLPKKDDFSQSKEPLINGKLNGIHEQKSQNGFKEQEEVQPKTI